MDRARRVLYVQYTNPAAYPPLEHSSGLLADAGWEVRLLGAEVPGAEGLRLVARSRRRVRHLPVWPSGWPDKLRYVWFHVWVVLWALVWRPAWVYVSDPYACAVGLLLTHVPGLKVVYHEHDAPPDTNTGPAGRVRQWARRRLAARAQLRVLPNEQRALHFRQAVASASPTVIVWNCPSRGEVAPPRAVAAGTPRPSGLRLLYHGSLVPARLPASVLHALARLPESVRLCVIGYQTLGHATYRAELRTLSRQLGIAERVEFRAEMPHPQLLCESRTSDVGLALMPAVTDDHNLRWMPGASNKPFDYLASGLALLVSDLPGWRELFVEPGYAVACSAEDPTSVAAALAWLLEHPQEMRSMGERGRRRVEWEWNYETQFAPVLDWLQTGPC